MTIKEIQTVCYVGSGTMGCFNALVAAVSGYDVILFDRDKTVLQEVPARLAEMAAMLVGGGFCDQGGIEQAKTRISMVGDLARATAAADLVSESVFEQIDIKRDVHRLLDAACPPHTILTTNSSYLLVSDIEDVVARGDRFAALHYYLGAPLVDIVGGPRTSSETIDVLQRFVHSTGGVPLVLKKEHRGYVLNAMLGPVFGLALRLVSAGIASVEEVDQAWMQDRSAQIGPFGMIDMIGVKLIGDSWENRDQGDLFQTYRHSILKLLRPMVKSGRLGAKTGSGFYQYPAPAYQQPGFLETSADLRHISQALESALIGSAALVAYHGVAEPADIDRAWMTGTYLDAGPFGILERMGVEAFMGVLQTQVALKNFDQDKAALALDYLLQYQQTAGKGLVS